MRANAPGWWKRVENAADPGTPDCFAVVQGLGLWLELKDGKSWGAAGFGCTQPKRWALQRLWLRNLARAGGTGFLLVRCRGEILLVPGGRLLHRGTREQWLALAVGHWQRQVDWEELGRLLIKEDSCCGK